MGSPSRQSVTRRLRASLKRDHRAWVLIGLFPLLAGLSPSASVDLGIVSILTQLKDIRDFGVSRCPRARKKLS